MSAARASLSGELPPPAAAGTSGRTSVAEFVRTLNPLAVRRTVAEWVIDGIIFAIALLAWVYYGWLESHSYDAIPASFWPVDRTLGLLAAISLWWTRRYPLTVALLLVLPGAIAVTAGFTALVAVYRAASLARPRAAVVITALHIVTAVPYHLLLPLPGMPTAVWLVVIPLLYALTLSVGLLVRSRRQVIEGLRSAAERDRENYERRLRDLRRDERERIAREMHDVLAHRISLLSVHAGALEYRSGAPLTSGAQQMSVGEIHDAASVIRDNAHLAIEDLRTLLSILRDETTADSALGTARPLPRLSDIPELVEEARAVGQHVSFENRLTGAEPVSGLVERTLYRVIQEGLTNARKHARHALVGVTVSTENTSVKVVVANPVALGVTGDEIPGAGAGLAGLAERVRLEGGSLEVGVTGSSFRLVARLPLREL